LLRCNKERILMADLEWIFDAAPASGARQGGSPIDYIFRSNSLDTFVREILQNSNDQRTGDEVVVKFSLHNLSAEHKQEFLDACGWSGLLPHLQGVASQDSVAGRRMHRALGELEGGPLTIMRIADAGTRGLTGGEDGDGNFTALCKDVLMTGSDQAGRGGSHGLGKAVLTRFSRVSTVFFGSRLSEPESSSVERFIGRTILPFHTTPDGRWNGNGWYGVGDTVGDSRRAVSARGDDALEAEAALLLEIPNDVSGTSILIFGFVEPEEETPRPLNQTAQDILDSAARWFWPSNGQLRPPLHVTAEAYHDDTLVFSGEASANDEQSLLLATAKAEQLTDRASEPGQFAGKDIVLEVPRRHEDASGGGHAETPAVMKLRITRADESPELQEHRNTIALVRGSGMVVQYFSPRRKPLDGNPFYGVLLAGLAAGEGVDDQRLELFLTAAEPPAHDEWTPKTDRIRNDYPRGSRARLKELFEQLNSAIPELCGEKHPTDDRGPVALSKMFPLGGAAGGAPGAVAFRTDFSHALLEDDVWSIDCLITRRSEEARRWRADVSAWLDTESGPRDALPLATVQLTNSTQGITAEINTSGIAVLKLPKAVDRVECVLVSRKIEDPLVARRTQLYVDAKVRFDGGITP
jgi:hypothetical protein